MEQSRTNNVIRNIISALLKNVIGMILPFVVRTCMIRCLGSEYIGLNNLCASILYVLSATDIGIANAFAYRLYKPIAQGNTQEVCGLLSFYRKVYFVIGMVILGLGLMILPFLDHFISQDVPENVNIYFVFFLYLINTVISYVVFAYKNLIFTADQKKIYESVTTLVSFCFLYISQIFLILAQKYYLSVIMLPLSALMCNMLRNWIANRKYPDYIPRGSVSKNIVSDLRRDIFSVAIYKFRDISRNAFDSIVISAFMGLIVLSNYQNYYMVLTVPVLLLDLIYASILPSVGNFAVSNGPGELYGIYKKYVFIMTFLSAWFAICFVFLIQDFIAIWLGAEFRLSWAAAVLFALYVYLYGEAMNIKVIRESIGLWNQGRVWAVAEMVTNLVLNVLLGWRLGVEGIILATIISMLFISIPMENRIIFSQYFSGKGTDKLRRMLLSLIWTVGTAVIVGLLCNVAPTAQYAGFVYKTLVCAVVPLLSCVFCFHRTEEFCFVKKVVIQIIRRILDQMIKVKGKGI